MEKGNRKKEEDIKYEVEGDKRRRIDKEDEEKRLTMNVKI